MSRVEKFHYDSELWIPQYSKVQEKGLEEVQYNAFVYKCTGFMSQKSITKVGLKY